MSEATPCDSPCDAGVVVRDILLLTLLTNTGVTDEGKKSNLKKLQYKNYWYSA